MLEMERTILLRWQERLSWDIQELDIVSDLSCGFYRLQET